MMMLESVPDYTFALLSVFFWAVSASVINRGLRSLPARAPVAAVLVGLTLALLTGTSLLFAVVGPVEAGLLSTAVVVAGILTFPIATGCYYLASIYLRERAELAAQFVKIKPLFSVALAVLFLGEVVGPWSVLSLVLILAGSFFLVLGLRRANYPAAAVTVGVLTAFFWALGEVFVKIGFHEQTAMPQTFLALTVSTGLMLPLAAVLTVKLHRNRMLKLRWLVPFALHGALSFGLAYSFFFYSIARIGVTPTALMTAFWPALALLFAWGGGFVRGGGHEINSATVFAVVLLLAASLLQVFSLA